MASVLLPFNLPLALAGDHEVIDHHGRVVLSLTHMPAADMLVGTVDGNIETYHLDGFDGAGYLRLRAPHIKVNDVSIPVPVRKMPAKGTRIFTPSLINVKYYTTIYIGSDITPTKDEALLARGLMHTTSAAAAAHAQAMLKHD